MTYATSFVSNHTYLKEINAFVHDVVNNKNIINSNLSMFNIGNPILINSNEYIFIFISRQIFEDNIFKI